jgi:hypothetical protein
VGGTSLSALRVVDLFLECCSAIHRGDLIRRESRQDKEFHFQNWFERRLHDIPVLYDPPGRNTYPDFRLVESLEGYEVKALAYPGREADFDSNSQIPSGTHNGRSIFYVFGRYPKDPGEDEYPVVDLVLCHGDFLNADSNYVHKNEHIKGFGSYGDIMIRDRKMYVVPTPFALTQGTTGQCTLILPAGEHADSRVDHVGDLVRIETSQLVVGYRFDLRTNKLTPDTVPNPSAGEQHRFVAYRGKGSGGPPVSMRESVSRVKKAL